MMSGTVQKIQALLVRHAQLVEARKEVITSYPKGSKERCAAYLRWDLAVTKSLEAWAQFRDRLQIEGEQND